MATRRKPRKRKAVRKPARSQSARAKTRRRNAARARKMRFARHVADAGVFCLSALVALAALFALIARDLPDTDALWHDADGAKITLLAADGAPLSVQGASLGAPVRLADLPDYVPQAILAVEDRNFYHHFGVNPVSIIRAAMINVRKGVVVQGGSTITQQLAKNVFLSHDRTIKRKVQEFILAVWLEHKFTKDEILTLYLNRVYFGAGAYGIDAASFRYFGKPARRLELGEAAVLAGLLKAPSRLSPTNNPIDAGKRGRLVVEQMVEAGFLTRRRAQDVISQPILLSTAQFESAPYFVDHVLSELVRRVGHIDADLVVRTTFDRSAQAAAETGFVAGLARAGEKTADVQAALVMVDGGGAIRALIGGRDYSRSQFNRATQARRQPGSAFKPFVYLAAAENGASANSRVDDSPVRIGSWAPDNYNSRYYGDVTHRQALALSLNSAAIRVQENIGRSEVRRIVRAGGWRGDLTAGPSLALGVNLVSPLELATLYAPFANGGFRVSPYAIESVSTSDGDILYKRTHQYEDQVFAAKSIESINMMLTDVTEWGTGKEAQVPGYRTAGKTGTTQDYRDAWFAGHAGSLVCVVWLGNDDNTPMSAITGGGAPAVIWREAMMRVLPPRYVAPLQNPAAGTVETN